MLIHVSDPEHVCPSLLGILFLVIQFGCHLTDIFFWKEIASKESPLSAKRNKETFGHDGYVHYLDYGYGFLYIHYVSKLFKWHTLNMCYLFHFSYTTIKLLSKNSLHDHSSTATASSYFIPKEKLTIWSHLVNFLILVLINHLIPLEQ